MVPLPIKTRESDIGMKTLKKKKEAKKEQPADLLFLTRDLSAPLLSTHPSLKSM